MKDLECEEIYMVGDIIDGWSLRRRWNWPQAHSDVIQKILRRARKGTKIKYILGNHDEFIRPFLPFELGDNMEILDRCDYRGEDGKRYLVVHGDAFDSITMTHKWLAVLGDRGYQLLLRINRPINAVRKRFGKKYWSLSKYIKEHVKKSVMFISNYEHALSAYAKQKHYDGIICGHIHKAEIREFDGIKYLNCGDWVESCTAIAQEYNGDWVLIDYHQDI